MEKRVFENNKISKSRVLEVFHNTNSPLKSPDKYQSPPPKSAKMVRWNRNLTPTS